MQYIFFFFIGSIWAETFVMKDIPLDIARWIILGQFLVLICWLSWIESKISR